AEDGIRDLIVTGVQTCALPILSPGVPVALPSGIEQVLTPGQTAKQQEHREIQRQCGDHAWTVFACNNSSSGMEKHIEEETRRQNKCEKYENNRPYWKHPYDGRKDDGADDTGDMDRLVILLTVQRGCISLSPACE